ncbi:hypothetical protein [Arthrobacter sp. W4I7]|uniref:hypothetical protein n=1 Tax=Arthrobacter sp. W4I7 TaxID=3042296 RepID=UPI00278958D2|nr:hypothetical protein [Arthrobacter sp. W4I7]MDQ0691357.1 hypothetical protein [Arthrobacter sp. W4I7]
MKISGITAKVLGLDLPASSKNCEPVEDIRYVAATVTDEGEVGSVLATISATHQQLRQPRAEVRFLAASPILLILTWAAARPIIPWRSAAATGKTQSVTTGLSRSRRTFPISPPQGAQWKS